MQITDKLIKKSCSSTIYTRGVEYFKEGRVHIQKREDKLISAIVDGEDLYNVQIKLNDSGIEEYFCTCPYYETMNCVCKHIVAVLKQRRAEQLRLEDLTDTNDRLAGDLCREYDMMTHEKEPMFFKYILSVNTRGESFSYSVSLENEDGVQLRGIENFLDAYINNDEFNGEKKFTYSPEKFYFPKNHKDILDILAENYQNRSRTPGIYSKSVYRTEFGAASAKRIFNFIPKVEHELILNGMRLSDIRLVEDNPDILVDIEAETNGITLCISNRGTALVPDGEWFFFEGTVYKTDIEWRRWFMPIYRALSREERTRITFKGNNSIIFASKILPALSDRHGVVTHGVEEMVINERPVFAVYPDFQKGVVSVKAVAKYGDINLDAGMPSAAADKIIIRDDAAESELISFFEGLDRKGGKFIIRDDNDIYDFVTSTLPKLERVAEIRASRAFLELNISDNIDISAKISYNKDIDLLEASFDTSMSTEQILEILKAVRLKKRFYRINDKSFIDLNNKSERNVLSILEELDFGIDDIVGQKKELSAQKALYLNAVKDCVGISAQDSFIDYINKIKNMRADIPAELEGVLRPYQKDGVNWMKQLSAMHLGGILADDMGLGKTLQVIAYIRSENPDLPALIVTPSALTYNWLNEIKRFTPSSKAIIIDGSKEERREALSKASDTDFIITSYPLLRRDTELYESMRFSYCFIDEAQYIKNPKTMNARSVKRIKADCKFALTGTPIENSLTELWSIFDFIMKGYLGTPAKFRERYEIPMIKENDTDKASLLKAKIKPFILRRMKSDVLEELPEKIENVIYADLTREQKRMYSAYLASAKDETREILAMGGGRIKILTLLLRLRQICCHPLLFDEGYKYESGKLELLKDIVSNAAASGHRILIFSQFTSMLEIIRSNLAKMKIDTFYIDGKTPSYERAELADRFNGGEKEVFLISLKAGGTGLNLIGADTVIHYDPWWNPAVMNQASDRAYRIGQTKAVQVIQLVSGGTIEEKILRLQERKKQLAEDIITENADTLSALSDEELMSLFE